MIVVKNIHAVTVRYWHSRVRTSNTGVSKTAKQQRAPKKDLDSHRPLVGYYVYFLFLARRHFFNLFLQYIRRHRTVFGCHWTIGYKKYLEIHFCTCVLYVTTSN